MAKPSLESFEIKERLTALKNASTEGSVIFCDGKECDRKEVVPYFPFHDIDEICERVRELINQADEDAEISITVYPDLVTSWLEQARARADKK